MSLIRQDVAHAVRALGRRPWLAGVAIATMAIAIAANSTMFSIVSAVLLQPLPFPKPRELVTIDSRSRTGFLVSTSVPNYRDWRDRSRSFAEFGAYNGWDMTLTGAGPARVLEGRAVVGDFFGLLGLQAAVGRVLTTAETADHAGMPAVVVLGNNFWRQQFGGDASAVGRTMTLEGVPYAIIGVLPPGVGFDDAGVEIYFPMGSLPGLPWDDRDSGFGMRSFARLKPGVDIAQARSDLDRVGRDIHASAPTAALPEIRSLTEYLVGNVEGQLRILMAAVAFVLLITVANVGNLLMARAEERQRELAVRAAIGAGRGDLARLLLVEAVVLALAGGAVGIVLAFAALQLLVPLLPTDLPALLAQRVHLDGTVLAFAVAVTVGAGILAGLGPVVRFARRGSGTALTAGARVSAGPNRLRWSLVVLEVTLAVVVIVGAGLMVRSLNRLAVVDKGFQDTGVLTAAVGAGSRGDSLQSWRAFYGEIRDRAASLPGVRMAALTMLVPLSQRSWEFRIHPAGVPVLDATGQSVLYNIVSPEYFTVFGIPLVRGRGFAPSDRNGAALVTIVDETLAQRFWPAVDPIGQQVTFEKDSAGAPVYRTIVGVVRNVRHYTLRAPSRIQVYVPAQQTARRYGMTLRLALKTSVPLAQVVGPLRAMVTQVSAESPVTQIETLTEYVDHALAVPRAMTRVLAAFAAIALGLAALGVFGLVSFDVSRRLREIGIRVALGASAAGVVAWVVRRALGPALVGVVAGLVAAAFLTRVLASLLFEVSPLSLPVYGIAAASLGAIAILAALLPARRATQVNPVMILKEEG
ncbi:MAG TPA: ABC transporter permease [Gemmatimonadales bacterium]|nr:ABC transporter permease [Gemmatimonadales bacterium]